MSAYKLVSRDRAKPGDAHENKTYLVSVTGDAYVQRENFISERLVLRDYIPSYGGLSDKEREEYTQITGEYHYSRHTTTSQRFLCVGGPLAGTRAIEKDAPGYRPFNAAAGRWLRKKQDDKNRVILVFEKLLEVKQ
jgi:hypothetical protein